MLKSMRWFAVLMLSMLLLACQKDPITADLEAFSATGKAAFGDMKDIQAEMNTKMQAATTNEARAALVHEMVVKMETGISKLKTFEAKSPEVKVQTDKMIKGFDGLLSVMKQMEGVIKNPASVNPEEMKTAMGLAMENQQMVMSAAQELGRMAKEKNVAWTE